MTAVLDHGFVRLVDSMGDDSSVVQAARVSTGKGTKTPSEDAKLIHYLMRNRHTTPFEMVMFKFHVSLPIVVARQWIRHRMASYNEFSGRYSVLPDKFYYPPEDQVQGQDKNNRQGSGGEVSVDSVIWYLNTLQRWTREGYNHYLEALGRGISRERARFFVANTVYTEWYWKVDLKNLLDFLRLRSDDHAQWEIRQYAHAVLDLIRPIVPVTVEAWEEYGRP